MTRFRGPRPPVLTGGRGLFLRGVLLCKKERNKTEQGAALAKIFVKSSANCKKLSVFLLKIYKGIREKWEKQRRRLCNTAKKTGKTLGENDEKTVCKCGANYLR